MSKAKVPTKQKLFRYLLLSAAIVFAYVLTGRMGLMLANNPGQVTSIFPAAGLAVSVILIFGRRYWPSIFLGAFALKFGLQPDPWSLKSLLVASGIGVASCLQALFAKHVIQQFIRPPLKLTRGLEILLFYILAGPLSCLIQAALGPAIMMAAGQMPWTMFPKAFLAFWAANSFGVLLVTPVMMSLFAAPRSVWIRRRVSVALPLISCLSLLIAFYVSYNEVQTRTIEKEFRSHGADIIDAFKESLENYQNSLSSMERLFTISPRVSRDDFRRFVSHSEAVQNHTLYALWIPHVKYAELRSFEKELNRDADQIHSLFESDHDGAFRSLQKRGEYFPVTYVEPDLHERAIGFDIGSDPKRLRLLSAARDDGAVHLTTLRRLVQDNTDDPAITMTRAVYHRERPMDLASRRESLKGFVSASFRLKDIILPLLQRQAYLGIGLSISENVPGQGLTEIARFNQKDPNKRSESALSYQHQFEFDDLTLILKLETNNAYIPTQNQVSAWAFMLLGLLFTTFLGGFLLYVTGRSVEAEQQAIYEKLLSDKFKKSEKNFRFLADSVPQLVWGADARGRLDFLNERWAEYTGKELSEAPEAKVLLHPDDLQRVRKAWRYAVDNCQPYDIEYRLLHHQGTYRWQLVRAVPMVDSEDGSIRWYGSCTDIHEQKIRSDQLAEAQGAEVAARESSRLKSEFLASMSHEIRTPINGVLGMTGLLLDTELSSEQRSYAEAVKRSGEGLLTIINDILDFSKIEAGKLQLESLAFPLIPAIDDAALLVSFALKKKNLDLSLDLPSDLPLQVSGDPGRLRQVLVNLLGNAVKFTEKGFVKLSVRARPVGDQEVVLCFEVSDSGIGISPVQQQHLFQPFSQADSSTTRRFGGTGLGLTIVKKLVEGMGGTIDLKSEEGKGSCFRFTIRCGIVQAVTHKAEEKPAIPHIVGFSQKPRILLVEDVAINQIIACKLLEKIGCRADVAANGEEALAALHSTPYDLVLMDCHMPVMDGFEATRRIRAQGMPVPIVAMTANAMKGDMERCLEEGMNDYISKPVDPRVLQATVLKWLTQRAGKKAS